MRIYEEYCKLLIQQEKREVRCLVRERGEDPPPNNRYSSVIFHALIDLFGFFFVVLYSHVFKYLRISSRYLLYLAGRSF